jgi:hypothetical protein
MVIDSANLNTLADIANVGINGTILNYSEKSYKINKEVLDINRILLNQSDNKEIIEKMNRIIELLEEIKGMHK